MAFLMHEREGTICRFYYTTSRTSSNQTSVFLAYLYSLHGCFFALFSLFSARLKASAGYRLFIITGACESVFGIDYSSFSPACLFDQVLVLSFSLFDSAALKAQVCGRIKPPLKFSSATPEVS